MSNHGRPVDRMRPSPKKVGKKARKVRRPKRGVPARVAFNPAHCWPFPPGSGSTGGRG